MDDDYANGRTVRPGELVKIAAYVGLARAGETGRVHSTRLDLGGTFCVRVRFSDGTTGEYAVAEVQRCGVRYDAP